MGQVAQFCRSGAETLAPIILDTTMRGTLLLILAAIAAFLCKRSAASFRHQIWFFAIIGVLALPFLSLVFPAWRILPGWSALPIQTPAACHLANQLDPAPRSAVTAPDKFEPNSPARRSIQEQTVFYSTAIWAIGAVLMSIRLVAGVLMLRASSRKTQPTTDPVLIQIFEIECENLNLCNIRLRVDHRRLVPFVCGVFRPHIILPASFTTWTRPELQAVLRHELAHIKRRDILTLALSRAACVVHWFNPLLWFAIRELNIEAEKSCDDYVLSTDIDHADYATQLVTASWFARESVLPALAITKRSQLERRVKAALESDRSRSRISLAGQLATAAISLLVALPLALAQPQSPLDPAFTPFAKASVDAHQPAGAPITLPIEPHVAIEFHANGSSSLTLDQFNSPAVSRTLAQIAVRKPRSLVLIRHTGQTNHVAVVNAARLCRDAGLRCTFVSNFSSDTSPQLPPEFRALPSKTRLVSLNVDAAGKFALRAYGFSKADLLATLAELQSPASRVVVGSREFFREFSSVQLAARAIATGQ